jgi:ABC-2 type transport system permease protein
MRNVLTILKRELMACFLSPIAYIVTVLFLIVIGMVFTRIVDIINEVPHGVAIVESLFTWLIFTIAFVLPMITMRLVAEEKASGTLEVLMTTPVTDLQVVLGKYFATLMFYVFMWLPTVAYVVILRKYSGETTPLDVGPLWSGYLGVFLVGMLLVAVGLMFSSITKMQVIAAMLAFAVGFGLFLVLLFFEGAAADSTMLQYFSPVRHIRQEFARGWIDLRRLVFYVSATVWCLYLTKKIIEARKWK